MADIEHKLTKEELDSISEEAIADVRREKNKLRAKLRRECIQAIYAAATQAKRKQSKSKTV